MSSEYQVTYERRPFDVEAGVVEVLRSVGYECEFAPGTSLLAESTEFFLMKVKAYPSPKARIRPERTFLVGAEIYTTSHPSISSQYNTTVRTTAGRSRLCGALQVLVAGSIAKLMEGELHDPQQGVIVGGAHAIAYALRKAQSGSLPHDLREEEFIGWPSKA